MWCDLSRKGRVAFFVSGRIQGGFVGIVGIMGTLGILGTLGIMPITQSTHFTQSTQCYAVSALFFKTVKTLGL